MNTYFFVYKGEKQMRAIDRYFLYYNNNNASVCSQCGYAAGIYLKNVIDIYL